MELIKLTVCILVTLQLAFLVTSSPVGIKNDGLSRVKRWGKVKQATHWPNATVYYKIACTEYTEEELTRIKTALQEITNKTCVKFIELDNKSDQKDYIDLHCVLGRSCASRLGFHGGPQFMNLARVKTRNPLQACLSNRKIQHEFLHALGFKHEHTSASRDKYLQIQKSNTVDGWDDYFAKDPEGEFDSYGCEFDYNSVMMPPARKHSKNGEPTLIPKNSTYTSSTIGIAEGISECDVTRINKMYCPDPEPKPNATLNRQFRHRT